VLEHPLVVLMGVADSGKSTVGPRLAQALDVPFLDADDFHTPEAKAQMAAGRPLDDTARGPWLDRLHTLMAEHREGGLVLACSALKADYRSRIAGDLSDVAFVALVAPAEVIEARLETRPAHFAGAALLPSQLDDLELGPEIVRIESSQPVDAVTDAAVRAVRARH